MNTTALLVILFLGFVFVSMFLVLWLGFQDIEEERKAKAAAGTGPPHVGVAGFLTPLVAETSAPATSETGVEVVRRLEIHVRAETRRVAAFGSDPSAEHLHEPANPAIDSLVEELEAYLRGEGAAAAGFAAGPSPSRLSGNGAPSTPNRIFTPAPARPRRS